MLELYARQFEVDGPDMPKGRKGRIFTKLSGAHQPTRKRLAQEMGIRPATLSEITLELVEDGLVLEARPDRTFQKGRPEIILRPNPNHLAAIVCYLVSHTIHCALVNLGGDTLFKTQVEALPDETDGDRFIQIITGLFTTCMEHLPKKTVFAGVALSLPGIVDEVNACWRYSSHWPKLRNLDMSALSSVFETEVTVSKNLNCELRARMSRRNHPASESLLLLHWGFGIGAAFANSGDTSLSEKKGFGEVGHTCVDPASTIACKCGMIGCIEAEASLWALKNSLADRHVPAEEWKFEKFLHENVDLDVWDRPIELMALTLRNLCLTLSPNLCIISGPFAQNDVVFSRLSARFEEILPKSALVVGENRTEIRAGRAGTKDEIIGAASTVFCMSLNQLCSD